VLSARASLWNTLNGAQVDVYKPVTSKANNSETYVTCMGFRGISDALLQALLSFVGEETFDCTTMLPRSAYPDSFVASVTACGCFFAQRTKESLEDALSKRTMTTMMAEVLRKSQECCADDWVYKNFVVESVAPEERLATVRAL
jgi:hypothetical protein